MKEGTQTNSSTKDKFRQAGRQAGADSRNKTDKYLGRYVAALERE